MRSRAGIASAISLILTVPAAVASSVFGADVPSVVAHVGLGAMCIAFAIAVFDFALPRWINLAGAAFGAGLGSIFLLQAVSLLVPNDALYNLAFPVLGLNGEKPLLDGILLWFLALLIAASDGKSRLVGLAVVSIAAGLELASIAAIPLGLAVPTVKAALLAPFVWLLLESAKGRSAATDSPIYGSRVADASHA